MELIHSPGGPRAQDHPCADNGAAGGGPGTRTGSLDDEHDLSPKIECTNVVKRPRSPAWGRVMRWTGRRASPRSERLPSAGQRVRHRCRSDDGHRARLGNWMCSADRGHVRLLGPAAVFRRLAEQRPTAVDRLVAPAQAEADRTSWPQRKWPRERVRMLSDPRWARRQEQGELVMATLGVVATLALLVLALA